MKREEEEQHGLEQMLGGGEKSAAIAYHMGPQEDLARGFEHQKKLICHSCFLDPSTPLAMLMQGDG